MPGFWNRLIGRRRDASLRREAEEEQMSAAERRFVDEPVEDHQADDFAEEHLGGVDPDRFFGGGRPPRDD
jgi:hypothetical protein